MTILRRAWKRLTEPMREFRLATTTVDIDQDAHTIYRAVSPYTMTNLPRVDALVRAVEYVVRRQVVGSFVECGVWRGGSVLAMLLKLRQLGVADRDVYLYDTFDGMTEPSELDTSPFERPATATWRAARRRGHKAWEELFKPEIFGLDQVRRVILGSGYPASRIHFVRGRVQDTIPAHAPDSIALLRLDTDWYASTAHELQHLYPRLVTGGVLIVDDYGHWRGCRRAVDEYFGRNGDAAPLLSRIDYGARIGVKS